MSSGLFRACGLVLAVALGCCVTSPLPAGEAFPVYDSIRPNVEFWTNVFAEWSLGQVVVHDLEHQAEQEQCESLMERVLESVEALGAMLDELPERAQLVRSPEALKAASRYRTSRLSPNHTTLGLMAAPHWPHITTPACPSRGITTGHTLHFA